MRSRERAAEGGFTMTELMVSVLLSAIATGFAFSIYSRASVASRAQSRVAEVQQTVRAATALMARDARQAGFYANVIRTGLSGTGVDVRALSVKNAVEGEGSDSFRVVYANLDKLAHVQTSGPPFNAAVTTVDSWGGFQVGDIALALRTADPNRGRGCVLAITQLVPGGPKLQHNPGAGAPWNAPGNAQCDPIQAGWNDGYTIFTQVRLRSYRIKPGDPRGILQMSPSGEMVADDWQDVALGVVDLQLALRVFIPGGNGNPDGDADPERDWYSSENMETILDNPAAQPLQLRISVLARTATDIGINASEETPSFTSAAFPQNNEFGDMPPRALPVTDLGSRFAGEHAWRWASTVIDLRNLGVAL